MTVDVVIPTVPGREDALERLTRSLERTAEVNLIVVNDSKTCGWGWSEGLKRSEGDYVLLACDDQEFLTPGWADICIETVEEGKLPCPRVWLADGTIESQGGDMDALAHVIARPQKDGTPVDYSPIPFMSGEQAKVIGMLPQCHYATDVWVSYRGRQLGWETILRHGFDVRHWHEQVRRGAGMSQNDRDAMDCAVVLEEIERLAHA